MKIASVTRVMPITPIQPVTPLSKDPVRQAYVMASMVKRVKVAGRLDTYA